MKRIIGFSTGVLYHAIDSISEQMFNIIYDVGCNHVEIHAHNEAQLDVLMCNERSLGACVYKRFHSRSVHLPMMSIDKDNALYFARAITLFLSSHAFAVMHPNFTHDFDEIEAFFERIAIENMDNRKMSFRTLQELREFFQKYPHFKLVFDVQHWVVNGYDVNRIPAILDEFQDRIVGVHLSGVGSDKYHIPVCRNNQRELVESLQDLPAHIPIVLEGVCADIDEMRQEIGYVKDILG